MFEPFFITKSAALNAGLGLPVVYGIVHRLGGTIGVDSALGQGTTFTIALRRASVIRGARERTPSTIDLQEQRPWTIMLVDDEEDVRG